MGVKEIVSNRKAFHNYEVLETFDAGIVLTGTEIKSLRDHGGNLSDAYVTISKGEAWLLQSSIALIVLGISIIMKSVVSVSFSCTSMKFKS